jgi:hypothetical protein
MTGEAIDTARLSPSDSVRMRCCTSSRYARRVRALFCLSSQICSSGMSERCWSVDTRHRPGSIATMADADSTKPRCNGPPITVVQPAANIALSGARATRDARGTSAFGALVSRYEKFESISLQARSRQRTLWLPGVSHAGGTQRSYGAGGEEMATSSLHLNQWSAAMPQPTDLSRSLVALDQNSTIVAVIELSQSSWLVGGMLPGIERQPCKKLEPSPERLLAVLALST